MFNVSTRNWTWLNGDIVRDKVGAHGELGIGSSGNWPGARYTAALILDPVIQAFYLFGGFGFGGGSNITGKFKLLYSNEIARLMHMCRLFERFLDVQHDVWAVGMAGRQQNVY